MKKPILKTLDGKKKEYLGRILLSAVSLLSVVFILVAITYSWYTFALETEVNGVHFGVESNETLLISVGEKSDVTSYDYEFNGRLSQITGNGTDFFEPESVSTETTVVVDDDLKTETATVTSIDDKNLVKKDIENLTDKALVVPFEFKAFNTISPIYVSPDCEITGDYQKNLCPGSYVESKEKRFSMNYISGALRVAIQLGTLEKKDGSIFYSTKAIWIPHPEFQLTCENEYYSLNPSGDHETYYYFHNSSNNSGYFSLKEADFSQDMQIKNGITYYLGNMQRFLLKTLSLNEVGYGRLIVWLEGTDRECQLPLIGYTDSNGNSVQGEFRLTFNLTL